MIHFTNEIVNILPKFNKRNSELPTLTTQINTHKTTEAISSETHDYPNWNNRFNEIQIRIEYLFHRSRWGFAAIDRQSRSISTQRDWICVMSFFTANDSSESAPETAAAAGAEYSRRSRPSRDLSRSFFADWWISESVPPPPSMAATVMVTVASENFSEREKTFQGHRNKAKWTVGVGCNILLLIWETNENIFFIVFVFIILNLIDYNIFYYYVLTCILVLVCYFSDYMTIFF